MGNVEFLSILVLDHHSLLTCLRPGRIDFSFACYASFLENFGNSSRVLEGKAFFMNGPNLTCSITRFSYVKPPFIASREVFISTFEFISSSHLNIQCYQIYLFFIV